MVEDGGDAALLFQGRKRQFQGLDVVGRYAALTTATGHPPLTINANITLAKKVKQIAMFYQITRRSKYVKFG
ncbi:hypothetical protein QR64_00145 [Rhodococcus sp. Chr-9]|nr:hypothetical protein QR64_00145 [Rhodococcus sp. Chr-9]